MTDLWKECLSCKNKCCKRDVSNPLFLTKQEKEKHPKLNTKYPCFYFNKKELCGIHSDRPIDCRIWPFDILKINGKFCWIVWNTNCSILKNKGKFEEYLQQHERKLIPKFKEHIKEYSKFRLNYLLSKYKFKLLREVKI